MSKSPMETYLETVDSLLKEYGLLEQYHCKVKDHSMLRMIDISTKKRLFVKEEHCEKYIAFIKESKDHLEKQFDMVNETNYFQM